MPILDLAPPPTINQDDYFLVTYNGTYARDVPVYERGPTKSFEYERITGPLPIRGYEFDHSINKADSLAGMLAGEERLLRFETVANAFGDPRSGESRSTTIFKGKEIIIPNRVDELRRLGVRYGCYTKPLLLPTAIPDVTIRSHSDGTVIVFPAQDPDNTALIYGHVEDGRPVYDIATLLAQSKRQQEILARRIEALEAATDTPAFIESDVKVDAPPL